MRSIRSRRNAARKLVLDILGFPLQRRTTIARTRVTANSDILKRPAVALPTIQNDDGTFKYLTDYDAVDGGVIE